MKVAVIGLGKLGCPLAAVLASAGHSVVGIDHNEDTVYAVNHGQAPVEEPGLAALLAEPELDLAATSDYAAIGGCDVSFVIVPTPSDYSGRFVNDHVLDAVRSIGNVLRATEGRHTVVISSTVMPGAMERAVMPALVSASGRKIGKSLGLCYSPEFIALGSVLSDIRNPDMVLIGEANAASGDLLEGLLSTVTGLAPVVRMNMLNAEIAKISVNAFVTMKLSFANTLGELCEQLPGADASVVAGAIGLDRRIGSAYLRPAMAYGGPCFPRDTKAFAAASRAAGVMPDLAEATDAVNARQVERLVERVLKVLPDGARVCVLGLAYKPETPVTTDSCGVALVEELLANDVHVTAWDPVARPEGIEMARDLEDALLGATVIVICTPWPQFAAIETVKGQVVIDGWRLLDDAPNVIRVGRP
jgi:UDPglucose 6-dehydrogenase